MQEVDFASLTAREAAPDPASPECGADMELYMQDCRQLLALGLKRWGGDAPGRLGPRVLNPDEPRDRAMIEGMFAPHPEADGTVAGPPPLQQAPAQAALPPAPQLPELQGSTAGDVRVAAAGEGRRAAADGGGGAARARASVGAAVAGAALVATERSGGACGGARARACRCAARRGHGGACARRPRGPGALGADDAGLGRVTPPPPRTCPPRPRTCTAPTRLPSLQPFTLSRPRTGACKLVNRLRKKPGAPAALTARAGELWTRGGRRTGVPE